jgi:hypothetical protein
MIDWCTGVLIAGEVNGSAAEAPSPPIFFDLTADRLIKMPDWPLSWAYQRRRLAN